MNQKKEEETEPKTEQDRVCLSQQLMPTLSNSYFLGFPKLRKQPRPSAAQKRRCKNRKRESWPFLSRRPKFVSSFLLATWNKKSKNQPSPCMLWPLFALKIPLSRKHAQSVSSHLSHISYLWTQWEDGGYEIMTGFLTFSPVSPVEIFIKYI